APWSLAGIADEAGPAWSQIRRISPEQRQADRLAELAAAHGLVLPLGGDLGGLCRVPSAAVEAAGERGHRRSPAQDVPPYQRQAGAVGEPLHRTDLRLRGGHVPDVDGAVPAPHLPPPLGP